MSYANQSAQQVRELFAKGHTEHEISRITQLQVGFVRSVIGAMRNQPVVFNLDFNDLENRTMGYLLSSDKPEDMAQLHALLQMDKGGTPYVRRTPRKTPIQHLQEARKSADAKRIAEQRGYEVVDLPLASQCNCANCSGEAIHRMAEQILNDQAVQREMQTIDLLGMHIQELLNQAKPEEPEQQSAPLPESKGDLINQIKERSTSDLHFIAMLIGRELNKRSQDDRSQKS